MQTKQLDGITFRRILCGGAHGIRSNIQIINDLNVFPVPDGDTGTNMLMTARYGYDSIKGKELSLSDAAGIFASSAVFGARGNSGVILSQFFKGLAAGLSSCEEADAAALSAKLGCPVVKTVSTAADGLKALIETAVAPSTTILVILGMITG